MEDELNLQAPEGEKVETNGYVGIDTLQEQIRKNVIKTGFEFNLLVVGRSGLGKSTLVNTLFRANVSRLPCQDEVNFNYCLLPSTTEIKSVGRVIEEKGMRLRLTVTDTPGFGDNINNDNCWLPIMEHINQQYEEYLNEEMSINRKPHIPDTRIHCCLYFIAPTGHSLRALDVEVMKRLVKCINVIPVIAKADTLTLEERSAFKKRIKNDLLQHEIVPYPPMDADETSEEAVLNKKIREMIPYAVVGSNQHYSVNNKNVLGRQTRWGVVEVENRNHCEFADLRDVLIRSRMQDLVQVTASVHYENFRREKLQARQTNNSDEAVDESCL